MDIPDEDDSTFCFFLSIEFEAVFYQASHDVTHGNVSATVVSVMYEYCVTKQVFHLARTAMLPISEGIHNKSKKSRKAYMY